jgi:hypothetical protein
MRQMTEPVMTNTMLGELARLFKAEARDARSITSQARFDAIARDLEKRQRVGQLLGDALPVPAPLPADATDAAKQAYADQMQRIQDFIKQQQLQAGASAKQAGTAASTAAAGVTSAIFWAVIVGVGIFFATRRA